MTIMELFKLFFFLSVPSVNSRFVRTILSFLMIQKCGQTTVPTIANIGRFMPETARNCPT